MKAARVGPENGFHLTAAKVKHAMAAAWRTLGSRLGVGSALLLAACANDRGPNPHLPRLGMITEFTSRNLCSLGISPELRFGNPPANAATYRLRVTEISTLYGARWQADVRAEGASIIEGAMTSLDLPCPGEKQTLNYRFEALALAADGTPLAYGWTFASARALSEQRELEQRLSKSVQPPKSPAPTKTPTFFLN